jgi:cation diffusion facilitator family transporter
VAIVGVIAASSALAGYEALLRLLHPQDVHHPWAVVAAGLVGFLGNEAVAVLRIRVGTRIGSAALVADGHHARTDGLTSLGVVVGALGVVAGLRWADPLVGLLITVAIAFVLVRAAKEVLARLLDQVDEPLVERIEAVLAATPGVQAVDEVRARWVGHGLRAEATVEVDPQLTVGQAHDITSEAERRLVADVPRLVAATLHAHPLGEAGHLHEGPHAHAHADDHPHQDLRPTTGDGPVT